jgi:hypothetical protein
MLSYRNQSWNLSLRFVAVHIHGNLLRLFCCIFHSQRLAYLMAILNVLLLLSALSWSCLAQSNAQGPPSDPYACSPTKPCKIGCCGKNNVCGLGPSYCSIENCTSTCTAKSECDPGWGAQWSTAEKCPVCHFLPRYRPGLLGRP